MPFSRCFCFVLLVSHARYENLLFPWKSSRFSYVLSCRCFLLLSVIHCSIFLLVIFNWAFSFLSVALLRSMSYLISSTSIVAVWLSSFAAAPSCCRGPSCGLDDTSLTSSFGAAAAFTFGASLVEQYDSASFVFFCCCILLSW